jgi:hypothetical protein
LLACDHYHVIFTLPHDLNPLWLANVAQNQHSCHQPPTRMLCSLREPLTLSPLQPDSGRRYVD